MESPTQSHDVLFDYLQKAAEEKFDQSIDDCATFLADWIRLIRGFDVMAGLRRSYIDADAKNLLLKERNMMGRIMDLAEIYQLPETHSPSRGDVGLFGRRWVLYPGIFTGDKWVARSPDGMTYSKTAVTILAYKVNNV